MNKNKKGVSLIILVITVVVLTILAGMITINTTLMTGETTEAKFKEEIKIIEDKVKEYYVLTGTLPVLEKSYTMNKVLEINTRGSHLKLKEDIVKNGDENSKFYLIDYDALGITLNERGKQSIADDIYVVASETKKVYYVRGEEIEGKIYFSNTSGTIVGN